MAYTRLNPVISTFAKNYAKTSTSFGANTATYQDFDISGFSSIIAAVPYFISNVVNGGAPGALAISVKETSASSVRCIVHNAGSSAVNATPCLMVIGVP